MYLPTVFRVAFKGKFKGRLRADRKPFRADIQGLRAVAVLAVIADHLLGYPAGGFVGVDIFFVISGFLITALLLREQEKTGRISFAGFYRRRVRRIIPVAVIVLAVTVAASWSLFPAGRARTVTLDGFYALIFGANWRFAAAGTDYMQAEGPVSPLQHFWSLAVEEQFYVVWPWLIVLVLGVLAHRLSLSPAAARRVLAVAFVVVIIATFLFAVWETDARPTVAYFSTVSRTWELAIGSLIAVMGGSFANLNVRMRTLLGYLGLAGIAWSLWFVTSEVSFPGPWAAVPVVATAAVIAAGTGGDQPYLYPLTNRVSCYIGDISYSLYLWHFPVIILLGALIPQEDVVTWTLMVLGMVALSVASYHFVEDPIRKSSWLEGHSRKTGRRNQALFDRTSKRAGVGVLALVAALMVVVALTQPGGSKDDSYQARPISLSASTADDAPAAPDTPEGVLAAEINQAISATEWPELNPAIDQVKLVPEWVEDQCLNIDDEKIARCSYGDPAAAKTAVVIGDSVAVSWMPGLRESLGKQGWKIQLLTMELCPAIEVPVERYDGRAGFREECLAHQRWTAAKVSEMNPDMVIVASALGTRDRIVGLEDETKILEAWEEATVKKLEEMRSITDGEVVLISVAARGKNLLECATKVSKPQDCMAGTGTFTRTVESEEAAADAVEGVRFVSTVPWFCGTDDRCPAFAGSTPIFAEGGHITPEYSRKLAPLLQDALLGTPAS